MVLIDAHKKSTGALIESIAVTIDHDCTIEAVTAGGEDQWSPIQVFYEDPGQARAITIVHGYDQLWGVIGHCKISANQGGRVLAHFFDTTVDTNLRLRVAITPAPKVREGLW